MPLIGTIGRILETQRNGSKELRVEWQIDDFFSLSDKVGTWYDSPLFVFSDGCWLLSLYPNCISRCMGFYLYRKDSGPPKTIHYAVGIKGSCGIEKEVAAEREFSEDVRGYGHGTLQFISRSELKKLELRLMPNNKLTITCNLKSVAPSTAIGVLSCQDVSIQTDEECGESSQALDMQGVEELQKSLQGLLVSREDSDVLINVQGKEFPAHRSILRARSPVFKAMFTHDMVEKQSGMVTMEDCDPESFPAFLEHVYSGSTRMISTENFFSLYTASDKYNLSTLKKACIEFVKRNLNISSFCDAITLAVMHSEKELTELATEFFCSNSLEICKTVEWQIFLRENTTVGNELLIKAFSK